MNWPRRGDRVSVPANDSVLLCTVIRRYGRRFTVRVDGVRGPAIPVATLFGITVDSEGVDWARGWSTELLAVRALAAAKALL